MDVLRVGVVGVGEVGASFGRALATQDRVTVTALCDPAVAPMASFAADLPDSPVQCDEYRRLLDADLVDAVFVATPNLLHAPVAVDALRRGKHVLVTKPLASSLPAAASIVDAVGPGTVAMMVLPKRYEDGVLHLGRLVRDGFFGEIYYARVRVARRSGIPSWSRASIGTGGGVLRDMGVHFIDAAWWLMGRPEPVRVLGASGAKFGPRGVGYWSFATPEPGYTAAFDSDDYSCGTVCFDTGAALQIETFWAGHLEPEFQLEIQGTDAGARLYPLTVYQTVAGAPHTTQIDPTEGPANPRVGINTIPSFWRRISTHFVACVLDGIACESPVHDGLVVQRILEALLTSAREQRAVRP